MPKIPPSPLAALPAPFTPGHPSGTLRLACLHPCAPPRRLAFREGLAAGERRTVFPILRFLLEQEQDKLAQVALVGYHLLGPELPPDLAAQDEEVAAAVAALAEAQERWAETHRAFEDARRMRKDPAYWKAVIQERDGEKKMLENKVSEMATKVKAKLEGLGQGAELGGLLALAQSLRRQQDEAADLKDSLSRERTRLDDARGRNGAAAARLHETRGAAQHDGSPEALIAQLKEEVADLRAAVADRLPRERQRRLEEAEAVERSLKAPNVGEGAVGELQRRLQGLTSEVAGLEATVQEAAEANLGDAALRQQTAVARVVARKKEEAAAKLEKLRERQRALAAEYGDKAALAVAQGGDAPLGDASSAAAMLEERRAAVQQKLERYRAAKRELRHEELFKEKEVLERTENLLKRQEAAWAEALAAAEAERGVSGATAARQKLEEVSSSKGMVDEEKAAALGAHSSVVTEIRAELAAQVRLCLLLPSHPVACSKGRLPAALPPPHACAGGGAAAEDGRDPRAAEGGGGARAALQGASRAVRRDRQAVRA